MGLEPSNLSETGRTAPREDEAPSSSVSAEEICSWASRLAAESRDRNLMPQSYVWPKSLIGIIELLNEMRGGLVAVIGLQGVGKSTALMVLEATEGARGEHDHVIFFKWRKEKELLKSLLDRSHEASEMFLQDYGVRLAEILKRTEEDADPVTLDSLLQRKVGKSRIESLRKVVWMHLLRTKKLILIDTPDYSKTDKRAMATDLADIYWLWNNLARTSEPSPNMVVAVQKEMFGSHFFFDKMHKIELEPLEPTQMVEAFRKRFGCTGPFTEDALMTIARMSQGIFRRFQRYIILSIKLWRSRHPGEDHIGVSTVKDAVPVDRLAQDMELELSELYPKHADLRLLAVRALLHLQEKGATTQDQLAEYLGIEPYAISRLLSKLELYRYVTRERVGSDKTVKLAR